MDVKTVFLNENLEEEVYMTQLEGFVWKDKSSMQAKRIYLWIKTSIEELEYLF